MSKVSNSELRNLIAPQIENDEFYSAIQRLAQQSDIKTILEIGSSCGGGSTEAFVQGLREKPSSLLFCIEMSDQRCSALATYYEHEEFVQCYHISSIPPSQFPTESEILEFYDKYDTLLRNFPRQKLISWLRQDRENLIATENSDNGIQKIKIDHNIENFDLVLLAGSEFTGNLELNEIYGANFILLEGVCSYKNYFSHQQLLADPNYALIGYNASLHNGYSIFRRLDHPHQEQNSSLPIHFFTIVLNGEPFIRYHIDIFNQLPFQWHWHIVEGVADLKHDTAWSLERGGQVTDGIHHNGLSKDGTTAYLDELVSKFPKHVTLYRPPEGQFWHGKREMVNAPLVNIQRECLLWQVDVDELWTVEQICQARQLFIDHPEKTSAFYWCWYFVGEQLVISSRNCYAQNPKQEWLRTWRFQPGSIWAAHEPPQLVKPLANGECLDIAKVNPFLHRKTEGHGLLFQHFAYVTREQLQFKEQYYGYEGAVASWKHLQSQANDDYPIFLREYFSWVNDNTLVERVEKCGIVPLAKKQTETEDWYFLSSQEWNRAMNQVKKPFPQIVIDGVFFQIANSGIARVWKSLLEEWVANGFAQHIVVLDRDGTAPRIPGVRYRPVRRFDYHQTGSDAEMLQQVCDEKQADLFISTYYTAPLSTPSVFMAYDMIPEMIGANLNEIGWKEKHYGIFHACRYITISQSTARDLLKFFPHIPEWAVTVAHCGVPKGFSPANPEAVEQFKAKFNLSKPYYLLVGDRFGVNGYKNAIFFFRALQKLTDKQDISVVCVGGRSELEPELAVLAEEVETQVITLDDHDLRIAYSGALALVYPSKYEGFGLPIAEAMACACPVIAGHHSSIPEVAGAAARYVENGNIEEMVTALEQVRNPEVRQSMISAGLDQVKRFSWTRMAEVTADVLMQTAEKIQNDSFMKVSPLWEDFRRLQTQLQQPASPSPQPPTDVEELNRLRAALQEAENRQSTAEEKLKSVREKLKSTRQQLQTTQAKLELTQAELGNSNTRIEAMKTSKFWKLRSKWFRIKIMLGLPVDDD